MYFLKLVNEAAIWLQFTETLSPGGANRFAYQKYLEKLALIDEWKEEIHTEAQQKKDR